MDFLKLAWKRKSVRNFKTDDVPTEDILKLLDAARSAPSGGNCQSWYFYAVKDKALKEQIFNRSLKQQFILNAPVFIVVCADLAGTGKKYSGRGRDLYSIQDTAAAIQNLLLCATDIGLAACWCGAFDEAGLSEILELREDLRPVAVIPVGYAVNDPVKTSRRSIEEICTFIGFEEVNVTRNEPPQIRFEHSNMGGARFNDVNLAGSEFVNINMRGCSFSDINLSDVKITDCDLTNMDISKCKLDGFSINGKLISDLLSD